MEELRQPPCILISSREQQNAEQEYYRNTLGFGGSYLFADNLEEARLLVVSGRGFLPVESVGTLPPEGNGISGGSADHAELLHVLEEGSDRLLY